MQVDALGSVVLDQCGKETTPAVKITPIYRLSAKTNNKAHPQLIGVARPQSNLLPQESSISRLWKTVARTFGSGEEDEPHPQMTQTLLQSCWSYLPPVTNTLIVRSQRNGQQCLQQLLDNHSQHWQTLWNVAVRGTYPLLKTGCFLLDTHHRDADF
ncbi:hypothetical protein TNCV_1294961 [Trichonephila clavipes]|nr:hypothetical protein TNCV_1294961 [Trichonephila clavipes]